MHQQLSHKVRWLLALGTLSWLIALTLQHMRPTADALSGFCLGMGVALQLGAVWRARHPARC